MDKKQKKWRLAAAAKVFQLLLLLLLLMPRSRSATQANDHKQTHSRAHAPAQIGQQQPPGNDSERSFPLAAIIIPFLAVDAFESDF